MFPKSMLFVKPYLRELLPTIKSMSTKTKREKLRKSFYSMTDLCWLLTQEDASPRNTEDLEPEPDIKNHIDDCLCLFGSSNKSTKIDS